MITVGIIDIQSKDYKNKFDEAGSVTGVVRPEHRHNACTVESIVFDSESVTGNPNLLIPLHFQ